MVRPSNTHPLCPPSPIAFDKATSISAVRACGTPLRNQRVVIFGAGTAGIGVADQIRDAMVREGLSKEDATARFWCVDRQGLLTTDMAGQLRGHQVTYARPAAESKGWKHEDDTRLGPRLTTEWSK